MHTLHVLVQISPIVLLLLAFFLRPDDRSRIDDLVTFLVLFVYIVIGRMLSYHLIHPYAPTFDVTFLRMDKALGIDPLAIYHWTSRHAWAEQDLVIVYKLLLTMVVLAWIAEQNRTMRIALVAGGLAVFVFYGIFPAIGPAYFDWSRGVASAMEPTNCMPSMHLAWAMLIAVNARRPVLKVVLWIFAGLTAVATVGLGQHYVVDLVAAVPYAAVSQAAAVAISRWATRRTSWKMRLNPCAPWPAIGDREPQECATSETSSPSNSQ